MTKKPGFLWIAVLAVSFFFIGFMVNGLIYKAGGKANETYLEGLIDDLGLDDAQSRQVKLLLEKEDEAIRKIIENHSGPIKAEIEAVRRDTEQEIRKLLTADQARLLDKGGNSSK